ncbi:tetratricopeptide repeat protein [Persicimonas caeni]|uniref:Tetratricopeptide repeat protein n=1 Tax=Persicimonas caeni TaxID=2292766 RepID=A0A4Y6Q168_PERCE|nr:tetratricopeptide repeat protein [Persicimonas caeni]QDG54293.1 tetratricopeptide repeat protein [Persicimonas caeni]QED35514.1 tetratricopeptide repeat protein [Persicimonas caeni]
MTEQIRDLQQTLKSDPSNREAFDALADQYAETGDWRRLRWHFEKYADYLEGEQDFSQLVFVLRELSEAEEDNQEKAAILVALGDVLFERVDNHDEGMDAYQKAFKTYPADTTSLDRARRIYRESGQFKRVLLLYDLEKQVKKGSEQLADVLVSIAQVHGDFLGDYDKAIECLDEALENGGADGVAEAIRTIYEAGGSVESAVKDKVREAHEVAGHGDQNLAAKLMVEAARLESAREGGGLRKAAELAEQARTFEPDHFEAGEFLMELYAELEQEDELNELTASLEVDGAEGDPVDEVEEEAEAEEEADPIETLDESSLAADGGQPDSIVEEVASLAGDFDEARAMLENDPGDLVALNVVRERLREDGAFDELVEQLEASVKYLRKKEGELDVMVELANTYWKELGDLEKAEYYFKRIKLLDSEQPDMIAFYEEFYRREGEWRKLFSLLSGKQADAADVEAALDLASQLAQIAEIQMGSPEKAIDVWKNFLREHDQHPEAREQLRRLYEENGKWNALVDFLKDRVRQLEDEGEATAAARVLLLERIADIYRDELGLDVMVINTLNSILELEPEHGPAFEELRVKLQDGKRWNDLAGLLNERAELELADDNELRAVELLLEVADIWQENLRNVTQALPYLERVVEIQPNNTGVRERLREIYEQRRDYESLFELMFAEAELESGAVREDRFDELLELAEDRLRDPERTVRVLAELVELRPDDDELLDKLEFIHRRRDDHARLAELLETKAERLDSDERREALREAAELREAELADNDGAARLWQRLLEEDVEDESALERLTAIYIATERFDELQEVYAERDGLDQLCELLELAAEEGADAEAKKRLHRRVADIAADELDDLELAVVHLEELAALEEDPRDVARQLDARYGAMGDLEGRLRAHRMLLEHAEDDDARFELLLEMGQLETDRDEHAGALEWLLQAATLRPGDSQVLDLAEQAGRDSEATGLFVEHLELIADDVDDEELRAQLWARLGRVLRDDQDNYASALEYFELLRERDPEDLDVLEALEGLYDKVDEPQKRIDVLREQIDLLSSQGAERLDLVDQLSKIADVQRTHLGEADAARETYNEILDLEPNHVGALRGIRGLHRAEEQWDEVIDSLHRELSLLSLDQTEARIDAQMELADTLRLHKEDHREAIHAYGQVLADDPQHEGAVAAVEELLSEPELAREAALMLEPIFRETDRPAQLAKALEARREVASDRFEEAEILDELIPLYKDRLDDTEQAFAHACREFELDPGREEVWLRVEQLGASLNRWEKIEEVFAEHAPEGHDLAPGRVNLLRHLAAIREYRLGKKEEALETWEQIHEVEPSELSVVEALERLYRQLGRQEELVDALEAKERLLDNDEARIEVLEEVAQLCDTVLEDAPRTIEVFRRVLLLEADHEVAVDGLVRLYGAREEWHELDELYVSQADLAVDPDRRRRFLLELGKLRAEQLADYAGAADLLSQLVTEDPGDDEAVSALEALDETLLNLGDRPGLRLDLARTLEPVYRSRDEAGKLAAVLSVRAEQTHEPFEKVALLDELVDLYLGRLSDDDAAFEVLLEGVVVDPEDEGRRSRLMEVARRLERLEDGAHALEEAAVEADPMAAGAIYRQLGALYEDTLQRPSDAIAAYEQAREQDERDEQALLALERLYQNTSDFDRLVENLRQQVLFGDPSKRVSLLERMGTLYEEVLDRPEDAIDVYAELLDEEPDSTEAFEALERLYARLERHIDLADVMRRRAESTYEEDERVAALARLAQVYRAELHDVHEAIAVHREILAIAPQRHESLDALEEIFEEEAQWHELADILRQKLMASTDDQTESKDTLELKLAGVLREQLFEVDEALGFYRSVLQRTPGKAEAIEALEELVTDENWAHQITEDLVAHYRNESAHEKLVELYEARKEQSYDPSEKANFLEKIAHTYRDGLDDADEAISALSEAWKLEPHREELHEQLLDLAGPLEAWARLAEAYEDVVMSISDPDLMGELRLALAQLYRDQLDDTPQAETNFREVLALDDRNEAAYAALESIMIGEDRWLDFVELLERKFNVFVGEDEAEARDILLRAATVQEEQLDDGFSAAETFRRVLDLDPTDPSANKALSRLYREQERWQDLADHLRQRIGLTTDPEQAVELKQELADLQRTQLLEPMGALDLYREVLNFEPDYTPAVEALEAMFEDEASMRADIAETLEPIYRREEAHEKLVDALLARAEDCRSVEAARTFLQECAQLAEEHLGDRGRAAEILTQIFDKIPGDRNVRLQLHRLHTVLGEWNDLVMLYEDVLQNNFEVDDELRVDLLVEKAALYEERLGELEDARQGYAEVLLYDVDNDKAVDGIERVLARTENWLDLAEFYRDRADATTDPDRSREWLERLATLYEEVLDDLDEAIAVYSRLNDLDPGDEVIQGTLARLYGHARRWHDLADLYRRRIEQTFEPEEAMELRFRLAGLLESELDLLDDSLQIYRDILADSPGHQDTLRALEGLRRDLANREGDYAAYRSQIVDLLLEHYNEQKHWRRFAELLEEKQELVSDIGGRVDALSEMAEVIQRGAQDDADKMRALMKLARAYCIDPNNESLKERVHERANQLDGWERVIPIFLRGLEASDDPDVQAAILIAVADAYAGPLDDIESAITAYQQAVEINGDEQALSRLQHLYGELELWGPLVRVLERRLENEFDGDTRQSLLKRIAMIYDEILGSPEDALRRYEDLREEDPSELSVIDALVRLYEQTERWADLEDALRAKSELLEDDAERVDTLRRLARVQDEQLGEPTEAIMTYQTVVGIDEEDIDAVRALSRLFQGTQRWPELLDNLAVERDFAAGLDELNDIEMRMAIVLMDKLDAPFDAVEHLENVVERDAAHMDAREALLELLDRPEARGDVAPILQRVYRGREEWGELQGLYEQQLEYLEEPQKRAEVFMELAQLQEEQFETRQMAFITLGRAFRELPDVTFLRHELERLSRSLENVDELAAVYEDTLEMGALDPDVELELRKRVGQLYAEELQAFDASIEHFEAAQRIDEFDAETLDWLDRLFQHTNQWEKLAAVLETRLAVTDPDGVNDVRFRLAYLREVIFEEHHDALDLYRQIIIEEPEHGGAIEGLGRMIEDIEIRREVCDLLEPVYNDLGEREALANLFELKLDVADSSAERADLHRRIAEIQIGDLENVYVGYAHLGRALREDPHDYEVQERLESLAGEHELYDQLVALYEDVVEDLEDPVRLVELAMKAAGWAFDRLEEAGRSADMYRMVLDIEPENEDALDALETIARTEDQPTALEAVLRKKAELLFDPDERKSVLLELGQVRMRLESFDEAIEAYQEALTLDEADMEVLHQLVALFEITERYEELVDTLETLAAYIKDADEQRMLYVRIGQYTRHFVDAPERSIEAYRRANELAPDDRDVLMALEELYEQTEQWHNLLEIVERELAMVEEAEADDPDERLRLYVQRARVNYEHFEQAEQAIEDYQRAFAIQKDSDLVVSALDGLYRAEGRWDDLMELYREQLQLAGDEDRLVELHIEMADICQEHLDDFERAFELLDMVLELRPQNRRALDVLQSMYVQSNQWDAVAEVLSRKAQAEEGAAKIELLLERADVFEQKLEQLDSAAEVFVTILEVDPTHQRAIDKLKELYASMGAWAEQYAILEHEAEMAETEDDKVAIFLAMAELARKQIGDPALRTEALERAYALRGDELSIVEPLLDAYIASEDFDRAEPILENIIATLKDERKMQDVVRFEHLKGKLTEQKGDLEGAKAAYEAAHKVDATYIPNLLSLGKLLVRMDDWDSALKIFQTLLLHQMNIKDDEQKVELFYYLGRVRLQKGDARRAKDMFSRALGIDADHEPSKQALAEL